MLKGVGKCLAEGLAKFRISPAVLTSRMSAISQAKSTRLALAHDGLVAALLTGDFSNEPDAVIRPSYELYADVQISFQSFTEFRQRDGRFHIPQVEGAPVPIDSDPRLFKLFGRGGLLDTAGRFHSFYSTLPDAPSLEDILCGFGRRVNSILQELRLDADELAKEVPLALRHLGPEGGASVFVLPADGAYIGVRDATEFIANLQKLFIY